MNPNPIRWRFKIVIGIEHDEGIEMMTLDGTFSECTEIEPLIFGLNGTHFIRTKFARIQRERLSTRFLHSNGPRFK